MTAPALVIVVAPYSRCTPMARKTTSVARSPSVMSAVAPEPTPVAIAATPSSASPRHVASSASHSGITLAAASASSVARPSRSCRTSSAVAQPQPDDAHTRGFAPLTHRRRQADVIVRKIAGMEGRGATLETSWRAAMVSLMSPDGRRSRMPSACSHRRATLPLSSDRRAAFATATARRACSSVPSVGVAPLRTQSTK